MPEQHPIELRRARAERLVRQIRDNLESARVDLLDLHDSGDWRWLPAGYATWPECVAGEFGDIPRTTVYRKLRAARIERQLSDDCAKSGPIVRGSSQVNGRLVQTGSLPESAILALGALSPGDDRVTAFNAATEIASLAEAPVSADIVTLAVALVAQGVDTYTPGAPVELHDKTAAAIETEIRERVEEVRARRAELARRRVAAQARRAESPALPSAPPLADDGAYRLLVGDARRLEQLEDGAAHGAHCEHATCPHPWLVVCSPPYNAGLNYDVYEDRLPWRDYWHGLVVPFLREAYRVLPDGGRLALNLANVVRANTPDGRHGPAELLYRSLAGRKWAPPGANGQAWAHMVAPLLWAWLRRVGFLEREQITWIKTTERDPDDEPANGPNRPETTVTLSTAWGTYASPVNPVLRAVAEPIFVASKATHTRPTRPDTPPPDITAPDFKAWSRNAWYVPTETARDINPAPWPVEIPRRLGLLYTFPGDLWLDPFVGTGSTAVAAVQTGRRCIGVDVSPAQIGYARTRVAREVAAHV